MSRSQIETILISDEEIVKNINPEKAVETSLKNFLNKQLKAMLE